MNIDPAIPPLVERLIEALRQELQHYGEMLARLEQQQERVLERAADEVLHSVAAVLAQTEALQEARRQREDAQREVAAALTPPVEPEFAALLPRLPEPQRLVVAALVEENNALLVRVQQKARQNHLLLHRSLELMQQFLHGLTAQPAPATYTGNGLLQAPNAPPRPIYEAVG